MITINTTLTSELLLAAYGFEELRANCKTYLSKNRLNFDKFTVVSHDSFIGYISEHYIKEYILNKYSENGVSISTWEDQFDISRIRSILKDNSVLEEDLLYIKEYFYDKYDLKISRLNKSLLVDVKTALTKMEPNFRWNFLYPVVQAHKPGKDYMILSYYVVNDIKDKESLKKMVIVGYLSEERIRTCNIIRAGALTRFKTVSQIDNYETELQVHYRQIDELLLNLN